MAIKFVNTIDLGFYNVQGLALQAQSSAPSTTVAGALYYNTDTDLPMYYVDAATGWVQLGASTWTITDGTTSQAIANGDTLTVTGGSGIDAAVTATDTLTLVNTGALVAFKTISVSGQSDIVADGAADTLTVAAGDNVTITTTAGTDTITINSSDQYAGTVTSVSSSVAGTALDVAVTNPTTTPAIAFTWAGTSSQYVKGDGTLGTTPTGTVTSVGSGAGLTGGAITTTGTLEVDYAGTDNIILAASDGTGKTIAAGDRVLFNDDSDDNAYYADMSQLKTYIDSGGTVTSVTSSTVDQLTVTNGTSTPALAIQTAAVANNGVKLATGDQIYDFVTGQGYQDGTVTSVTVTGDNGLTGTGTVTTSGTITLGLDYQGTDNYILDTTDGAATAAAADTINFSDATDNNVKETTLGQVPIGAMTLVKEYIDSTAGALIYQGAYNAATNTPDLDSSPSSSIQLGWTYTVSVAGNFFTEAVQVGDLLIAEADAPTTLAEWTVVQGNTDLATASAVGIGNVVPGSSSTITAPYSSGTATLDVVDGTAAQKGAVIVAGGDGINVTYSSGTATIAQDSGSGSSKKVVLNSSGTGVTKATGGGVTTYTIEVDNSAIFGSGALSANIMAETYLVADGITAYPEVTRDTSNTDQLHFKFLNSPAEGAYAVLLHNVA